MFELVDNFPESAVIRVIGVGGGGCNAVNYMYNQSIEGVDFICVNTDAQALKNLDVKNMLQIGSQLTKGLGAGSNPNVGKDAAIEDIDRIKELAYGADMIFITAGMGGGTGTGAAPVIAQVAKELGILTVAVITKPFMFEGPKRVEMAQNGILELAQLTDSLIIIPNDKLVDVFGKGMTLLDAFNSVNNILLGAVQGISELITNPGLINVDFADVKSVMKETGMAVIGGGTASGEDRAKKAVDMAISSSLLENIDFSAKGAKGILVNISAGKNMSIGEFETIGGVIKEFSSENATIVMGTVIDEKLEDNMRVTVIVTGIENSILTNIKHAKVINKIHEKNIDYSDKTLNLNEADDSEYIINNYKKFDKPTIFRKIENNKCDIDSSNIGKLDDELLAVPTFMRNSTNMEDDCNEN